MRARASAAPEDAALSPGGSDAALDPLDDLLEQLAEFEFDPAGFVRWAFPWGAAGTMLANEPGPEKWQLAQLERIGERLRAGEDFAAVVREAISAGHGVGKSAEVSWLILWAISTHEDTRGVVTANTETQLRTKTWAELAKWHQVFIAKELFVLTATALYSADAKHARTWRIDQIPWSASNAEAFAGLHNKGKRILVVFDEASAIDDIIWETTEGALTDTGTQIIWAAFGNPTRTTGRFHKVCRRTGAWHYDRVDAREVRFTNKGQIQEWIDEYGEDSDFVRVRVRGLFPRAGFANFIGPELVEGARRRTVPMLAWRSHQLILSVDPARFGDDWSVITLRQGLKAHWQQALSGFDGPELCGRIVELVRQYPETSCIVYDANGNGADLDSALRRAPGLPTLIPVMWGVPAKDDKHYFNQRSEAWGKMKDWLAHGEIPDDDILADELSSLDYGYDGLFRIQLQSKKDAKKNGGKSPDRADSLALSFIPELIDRKVVSARVRPQQPRKVIWSHGRQ
ncbi:MAG: terminase [Rubrivivax sp.]|nr:terminase [Rubrivivax sp.]